MTVVAALQPQDIQLIQANQPEIEKAPQKEVPVALVKSEAKDDNVETPTTVSTATYIQNNTQVQEYLHRIQNTTSVPFSSLQQFLKFNNTGSIKREAIINEDGMIEAVVEPMEDGQTTFIMNHVNTPEAKGEESTEGSEKGKGKKKSWVLILYFES